MTVGDIARTDVVTVGTEATLPEIARTMTEKGVGSVVIVEADGSPCGILTDRDLVTYGLATDRDPDRTIANDVMAVNMATVDAGEGVFDVIRLMAEEGIRRVPVTGVDGLYGIVTLDDFVVRLSGELANLAAVIEAESPPRASDR